MALTPPCCTQPEPHLDLPHSLILPWELNFILSLSPPFSTGFNFFSSIVFFAHSPFSVPGSVMLTIQFFFKQTSLSLPTTSKISQIPWDHFKPHMSPYQPLPLLPKHRRDEGQEA